MFKTNLESQCTLNTWQSSVWYQLQASHRHNPINVITFDWIKDNISKDYLRVNLKKTILFLLTIMLDEKFIQVSKTNLSLIVLNLAV